MPPDAISVIFLIKQLLEPSKLIEVAFAPPVIVTKNEPKDAWPTTQRNAFDGKIGLKIIFWLLV